MSDRIVKAAMRSFAAFLDVVCIDVGGVLVPFGRAMAAFQREDFAAVAPAVERISGRSKAPVQFNRCYWERPRGHAKSHDIAVICCWVLFSAVLQISGVVAAVDKEQAGLVLQAISRLVRFNPVLAEFLQVQRESVKNRFTGSELAVMSADVASSLGITPHLVVCDELSNWPRRSYWDSLFSSAGKRAESVVLVISNSGSGAGECWQWDVREAMREAPNCHFHSLPAPDPTFVSKEQLAEQARMIHPSLYKQWWLNQWTTGHDGDFLSPHQIERSKAQPGPIRTRIPGFDYIGGVDASLKRDRSAFIVLAVDHDSYKIRLAHCEQWIPQEQEEGEMDLNLIKRAIIDANQRYGFHAVYADTWQMANIVRDLRTEHGIDASTVDQNGRQKAIECRCMLRLFQDDLFVQWDCEELIRDLQSLMIVDRPTGPRLIAPRTKSGHADLASALAVAAEPALRILEAGGVGNVEAETTYERVMLY